MAGAYSLYLKSIASPLDDAKNKKFTESIIRYAERLQISNNPRDLVVASKLLDFHEMAKKPEQAANPMHVDRLKKAIALAPGDADIAWLEAMGCGRLEAACNRENAVARLKQMEPENLAVYLLAFDRADKAGDKARQKTELQAMANSRYSDIHYFSIGKLYYEAFRGWHSPMEISVKEIFGDESNQAPVTDDESRKVVAIGYSFMIGLPPLQQLLTHCKSEKLPEDELQSCQKIAALMVQDKTLIMHRIGLRIGLAVFKQEPAASQWREAFRTNAWLNMYRPNKKTKYSAREEIRSWPHEDEDEVGRIRTMRAMEGIAPTPPANWLPEDESTRKLLSTPATTKQ